MLNKKHCFYAFFMLILEEKKFYETPLRFFYRSYNTFNLHG
jgi:hypothetical protein